MKQNEVKMLEANEQKYMHECKSVFLGGGWGERRRRGCFVLVLSKRKVIVFVFMVLFVYYFLCN